MVLRCFSLSRSLEWQPIATWYCRHRPLGVEIPPVVAVSELTNKPTKVLVKLPFVFYSIGFMDVCSIKYVELVMLSRPRNLSIDTSWAVRASRTWGRFDVFFV